MKNEVNMLEGSLFKSITKVALPLAAISILQQFFNAADVAVVGRFASENALAAVGANTPIINMFLTFFTGLATGGNVAISLNIGMQENEKVHKSVQTIFLLSLICGLVLICIGEILCRPVLVLIHTPENVLSQAVLYLRIYLLAMVFAVIYNFISAILRSKGDTKRPLYCLIFSGILNVILNCVFVIGFHLDVAGVAIATCIANMVCAGITFVLLLKEKDPFRLSLRNCSMDKDILLFTLKIGLPAGIQGMLFSISNIIIQSGINGFGADCIAGNTAAMNFEFITYFIVNAFGQSATTFVSQNYGAGQYKRCKEVFRKCLFLGFTICLAASLCFYLQEDFFLSFFTKSEDVLYYAKIRMFIVVLFECITSFNEMPAASIRGLGISIPPTIIAILGTCVFRIVWVKTIFLWYPTIFVLMLVYPASWIFLSVCQMTLYFITQHNKLAA